MPMFNRKKIRTSRHAPAVSSVCWRRLPDEPFPIEVLAVRPEWHPPTNSCAMADAEWGEQPGDGPAFDPGMPWGEPC